MTENLMKYVESDPRETIMLVHIPGRPLQWWLVVNGVKTCSLQDGTCILYQGQHCIFTLDGDGWTLVPVET